MVNVRRIAVRNGSGEAGYEGNRYSLRIPLSSVEREDFREIRKIAATVFGHEHHVFDADGAQPGIIQTRLYRDHMPFLEQ